MGVKAQDACIFVNYASKDKLFLEINLTFTSEILNVLQNVGVFNCSGDRFTSHLLDSNLRFQITLYLNRQKT